MALFKNKLDNLRELGFGSRNYQQRVRFISQKGTVNVERHGLSGLQNIDIYHYLTRISPLKLALLVVIGYVAINLIFGTIYFLIGPQNFYGLDNSSASQQFIGLFFFSAQTITTLGYGHLHPVSNAASIAAAVESLLGLLSFAIVTGILFGRFSRPKDHVLYSKNILIAPYDEITGFMFRITNTKQYELFEAEAAVNLTMTNPETNKREFHNLELEISRINFLSLSWTIVHPIDEKSPLYGLSVEELEKRDFEVIILVKAISDTFSQTIYSRNSYKAEELVVGAKFKPIVPSVSKTGRLKISVLDVHNYEKVSVAKESLLQK